MPILNQFIIIFLLSIFTTHNGEAAPTHSKNKQTTKKVVKYAPTNYGIYNMTEHRFIESHAPSQVRPIASLTKLMTAYIFLQHMPSYCYASLELQDIDNFKNTKSKLPQQEKISCIKLLNAMLVSSDNMAAFSLSRSLPGVTRDKFVYMMNQQAKNWKMNNTLFVDPAGLNPLNVSTVNDLAILVEHCIKNPFITSITSQAMFLLIEQNGKINYINNTNRLVRELHYPTILSKTGYINESGYNLIFRPHLICQNKELAFIILGSPTSLQRTNFTIDKMKNNNCH